MSLAQTLRAIHQMGRASFHRWTPGAFAVIWQNQREGAIMATGTTHNPKIKEDDKRKDEGRSQEFSQNENKEPFDKVKEAGAQAVDKAKEAAVSVGEMASQAANAVGIKMDEFASTAGADIKKFGDKLRDKAPHDGVIGHASQAVADTIKGGGGYLEEAKLSGMADDVTHLIVKHPVPAILICLGVGFMLGRVLKD
jgi:hypothetical protein